MSQHFPTMKGGKRYKPITIFIFPTILLNNYFMNNQGSRPRSTQNSNDISYCGFRVHSLKTKEPTNCSHSMFTDPAQYPCRKHGHRKHGDVENKLERSAGHLPRTWAPVLGAARRGLWERDHECGHRVGAIQFGGLGARASGARFRDAPI